VKYLYCPNCGKMTGHKRALGWGTFFGALATFGASVNAIPFYPKRCIVCGRKSNREDSAEQPYSEPDQTLDDELQSDGVSQKRDRKKCPACAELIKLEAIKCRFCGERFDPDDVARQVAEARKKDSFENRVACSDGNCIGIIGPNRLCVVCGKPYKPDEY
jgi:hypothetical protein